MSEPLNEIQAASAAQFDRQSDRYGKSHLLADTRDVALGLEGVRPPIDGLALDIATGGGHTALHLARDGWNVIAGDISTRMLENARQLAAGEGFTIQTRMFPAEDVPFPDAHFELVTARVAPHHFSSPVRFVAEAARVLKPGGWLLLIDGSVPDDDPETDAWLNQVEKWRDPSHGRLLSRGAWEGLVQGSGLVVERAELTRRKQPDLTWWFETAATSQENRIRVLAAIEGASAKVRSAMRIADEGGKIVWSWPHLTLRARKPSA